ALHAPYSSILLTSFVSVSRASCLLLSSFLFYCSVDPRDLHSFPTRRSSDLACGVRCAMGRSNRSGVADISHYTLSSALAGRWIRSEEHTSELQSRFDLVCRLLLEKKNSKMRNRIHT